MDIMAAVDMITGCFEGSMYGVWKRHCQKLERAVTRRLSLHEFGVDEFKAAHFLLIPTYGTNIF